MDHAITVGQLRQNPTAMIREVQDGAVYTLTDRGRPVAEIAPYRPHRWRAGAALNDLLVRLGPDPELAGELRELREDEDLRDPWSER